MSGHNPKGPPPESVPPLTALPTVAAETVTEYAVMMSGGGYHVRNGAPEIEEIYPLAQWVKSERRFGGKVYRRRVVVIEDWAEVTKPVA